LEADASRVISAKSAKDWLEKELQKEDGNVFWFTIRACEDDHLLGDIILEVVNWAARDAFVGLGIGERDFWGRGYGTEAMNLMLEFAFTEIDLRRVTLTVFEYNPRAIRCYEKAGFHHEGRMRRYLSREGKRWDELYMGILREEWMVLNGL
jgi:RimJ/RimL family protein N-acetyltransferase